MVKPEQVSVPVGDAGPAAIRTYPGAGGHEEIEKYISLNSLYALFQRSAEECGDLEVFGHRDVPGQGEYQFITYSQAFSLITRLATALVSEHGIAKGDKIGVYGKNSTAWVIIQYAANAAGAIIVPIYDTLGEDIVEYVCNHAEVKLVFVADDNYAKWVKASADCPTVQAVVRFNIGAYDSKDGEGSITDLISRGSEAADTLPQVTCDDLYIIMYTSGTTGNPKGVMLTNGNFLASVGSCMLWTNVWKVGHERDSVFLSFLPLSHILEQQAEAGQIAKGAKIGYYSGDIKLLLSDLEALKPTTFIGVPRVFAKFQQKIEEALAAGSAVKRYLFDWAYQRQLQAVQCTDGSIGRNYLWDTLIMDKVKARVLPNVTAAVSGSAPMSAQTNDFLKICLNCPVLQGYGLTETVGGVAITPPQFKSGCVGGPLPGVEIKLVDIPEMDYMAANSQGEIAIRGKMISRGYYRNEEASAAAFTADGWFHTGDVGQWNSDGSLSIIDRKKNLFKLSQGEYVSPDKLEQEYAKAPLVLQIYVYGNSFASSLVAVVVPDIDNTLLWWKQRNGTETQSVADVLEKAGKELKADILKQLLDVQKASGLKSYEKIRDIIIENEDRNHLGQAFHVDNNLSTPTFKLKRPQLNEKYKKRLEGLYDAMDENRSRM